MINLNGSGVPHFLDVPFGFKNAFLNGVKFTEVVRLESNQILFWERHYFRIMASLRQLRFEIPLSFTASFLEDEIKKAIDWNSTIGNTALVSLHFYSEPNNSSNEKVFFVFEAASAQTFATIHDEEFCVDIYRDGVILGEKLSNISTMNHCIRAMASVYAHENEWDACIVLNHNKQISETTKGRFYLFLDTNIVTPPLTAGCQNTVLRKVFNDWIEKQTEYRLLERHITPFEMQTAQEVFCLDLEEGYSGITHYRKTQYPTSFGQNLFKNFLKSIVA